MRNPLSEECRKIKSVTLYFFLLVNFHHWKYFLSSILKIYNAVLYVLMNFKLALKIVSSKCLKLFNVGVFKFFKDKIEKKTKKEEEEEKKKPTLGTPSPANFSFLPSPISINERFILRNA